MLSNYQLKIKVKMNIKEKRVTKIWVKMNKNCKIYLAKKVQIRKVIFKIKWLIISLKS